MTQSRTNRPAATNRYRVVLGATIREIRNEKKLTLRQVAQRSYISVGHLSEVENGYKEISSELLDEVVFGLDISLAELIIRVGWNLAGYQTSDLEVELDYLIPK